MLLKVLDELGVPLCVGIGDGAGANIMARFGLAHPDRILGLVLVNLVSAGVGFLESMKEKFFSKRRSSQQLCPEEIVTMHKVTCWIILGLEERRITPLCLNSLATPPTRA